MLACCCWLGRRSTARLLCRLSHSLSWPATTFTAHKIAEIPREHFPRNILSTKLLSWNLSLDGERDATRLQSVRADSVYPPVTWRGRAACTRDARAYATYGTLRYVYHFAVHPFGGGGAKYCDEYVGSFVCLLYLSDRITRKRHGWTSPNFCLCCLWPWVGPSLEAMRYVMCFRFCGWRHVFIYRSMVRRVLLCGERNSWNCWFHTAHKSANYDCLILRYNTYLIRTLYII